MSDVNKLDDIFEDYMLVIDITLGVAEIFSLYDGILTSTEWGYLSKEESESRPNSSWLQPAYGALTVIKNDTNIAQTPIFYWNETEINLPHPTLNWKVYSYKTGESYSKVKRLFEKDLHITVDGMTYNLGKNSSSSEQAGARDYVYYSTYTNVEAHRFSTILKQTGKTKRLCINWK